MSKPKPPLHNLEFSEDVPFWNERDTEIRRVFLMPIPIPSEFLAFGVLGSEDMPLFAARGQVRKHLGEFIARMVKDKARVELCARPPLPGWLFKEYTSDPGYEGHEFEEPPPPPISGLVPGSTTLYDRFRQTAPWAAENAFTRRVLLTPLHGAPHEFLAFGVVGPSDKVVFALTGTVQEQLGELIARMVKEELQVELYARPPLPVPILRKYLSEPSDEHTR